MFLGIDRIEEPHPKPTLMGIIQYDIKMKSVELVKIHLPQLKEG